jgi:hypothetical protein
MRNALTLATVGLALAIAPAGAVAAESAESAEAQLAAAYSPVLVLEPQAKPCGAGEAYRPTSVDVVLGRADVVLRAPDGDAVTSAPAAADLFGLGEGYHLDLRGDPLRPGCDYERQFRRWNGDRKPSVYAHVATDAGHPGKLAVEYWLYYTFNDFTDKHESDWEMVQVDFDASSPEEALRKGPYEVDLSQHAGGERSDWTDSKLERQGTHPVIYSATGSHANYFGRALYLGRGAREGFGCDDTRDAGARTGLQTTLLPELPLSPSAPFAWLAFEGRWGQKEKGINNGPTGPAAKDSWSQPIEWSEGLRNTSVEVPGTRTLGPSVTSFFCGAVTRGSIALNWSLLHPVPFTALLGLIVAGSLTAMRKTAWRPPDPHPLRGQRRGGQILRATGRLYREDLGLFVATGAIFVPVSLFASALQWVIFHVTTIESVVALDGRHGAVTAFLALVIGHIGAAFASVLTTAAVAHALVELDEGRRPTAVAAFRVVFERLRTLLGGMVRQYVVVLLLAVTVVGLPFAIRRFIRWSLFAEACVIDGRSAAGSLRRSAELVEGRWWRTFGFTALVDVLAVASGPLFGVILLLLTDHSLDFINIAGSVVYALTVPAAAIALTLYYFDLEAREREVAAASDDVAALGT